MHRPARLALLLALSVPSLACGGDDDVAPPSEEICDADPLVEGCTPAARPAFDGLGAEVEVLRDASGVPHVYAANDRDAFYASGYMQAYDRLFQMELNLRRAMGTRAAVLGESFVEGDRLARLFDIPRWARTNEAALYRDDPERWALVQAWTEGVNARIREVLEDRAQLPAEYDTLGFEPAEWSVVDAFAFGKMVLFGNANQLESTILTAIVDEYLPELDGRIAMLMPIRDAYTMPASERPAESTTERIVRPGSRTPRALPPDAAARITRFMETMREIRSGGSNNWAIDGRHSWNGRPIVAGDPHQPLTSPSLFWTHHMNSADAGGSLDVIGWSFVGSPGVHLGHNRHVAWTGTTTYPDNLDVWDVEVSDGKARVFGVEVVLRERTERIEVAGGTPMEMVVEEAPGYGVLLPTDLSPLPIGRRGRRLLARWTGFRPTHELQGFHAFSTATSTEDFARAVEQVELGYFNFVFADANGIQYHSQPLVPDRGVLGARRPWSLSDGDDASTAWGEPLDRARMPSSRGAERGWVSSANNDPWGFTADGRLGDDPWYFGAHFDPGLRAARIEAELERLVARAADPEARITSEDMQALQGDTHSILADDFVPALLEAWAARDTDPALEAFRDREDLAALVSALEGWDRRMERAQSAPVVFNAFAFFLARRVLADDLTIVFEPIMSESSAFVLKWLSNVLRGRAPDSESFFAGEPRNVSLVRALDETAMWIATRFGDAPYTWGDVHGTRFPSIWGERLDGGWVPTDGAEGTVDVSVTSFFGEGGVPRDRLESSSGAIYRFVATFGEDGTPSAMVTVPRGVSGDPESEHWSDLHEDWIEGVYRPLLFRRAEIEAGDHERMTISP